MKLSKSAVLLLLVIVVATNYHQVHSIEVEENEDDLLRTDPNTGAVSYKGFKLIHATPTTEKHLKVLRFLNNGNKYIFNKF